RGTLLCVDRGHGGERRSRRQGGVAEADCEVARPFDGEGAGVEALFQSQRVREPGDRHLLLLAEHRGEELPSARVRTRVERGRRAVPRGTRQGDLEVAGGGGQGWE